MPEVVPVVVIVFVNDWATPSVPMTNEPAPDKAAVTEPSELEIADLATDTSDDITVSAAPDAVPEMIDRPLPEPNTAAPN